MILKTISNTFTFFGGTRNTRSYFIGFTAVNGITYVSTVQTSFAINKKYLLSNC